MEGKVFYYDKWWQAQVMQVQSAWGGRMPTWDELREAKENMEYAIMERLWDVQQSEP